MSLEKGIQRIGSVYIYAWIISLAFVFFGCLGGIIMVWLVGTPPPNTNDPNEYAGDDTKTMKMVWTIIFGIIMLIVPFAIYLIYSNRNNKSFEEYAGITGMFDTAANTIRTPYY